MDALIRQIVVLSVLWAVCEMLLPDGKLQQMARMTLSVLVMTALLSTAGEMLGAVPQTKPALAQQAAQRSTHSYRTAVLRSCANQAASYCRQLAQRVGYDADASVFLTQEGQLERIELRLVSQMPLMSQEELIHALASQFAIPQEKINLSFLPEVAP